MPSSHYKVGGHIFCVAFQSEKLAAECLPLMENYRPFALEPVAGVASSDGGDVAGSEIFELKVAAGTTGAEGGLSLLGYSEDLRQEEESQTIICGHTSDNKSVFEFLLDGVPAGTLVCAEGYSSAELFLAEKFIRFSIDNALMILYALATSKLQTVLFHGAVVSKDGLGYMFLGKSGTGKSTHARLWLKNISGTELVNDDNPVVRLNSRGGEARVTIYGSPWSGKTPCYKNLEMPLGAVVQLSQAPYNKIECLGGLQAYVALVPSISGKRWDRNLADGLHETENALAMTVPAFHLECLPDASAAELCCGTVAACGSRESSKGESC